MRRKLLSVEEFTLRNWNCGENCKNVKNIVKVLANNNSVEAIIEVLDNFSSELWQMYCNVLSINNLGIYLVLRCKLK